MAERKRRPVSGKIKPGTPHPTKAYTVRGYDGRWISRKAFNAAKRAREKAKTAPKKGGSLVKRASSAITKASKGAMTKASKAGELLKIRKGDKGIVRAIKDTYKFGKRTRKSADAVYKAGKVSRQVHDKLVKGGKEFVKGTVEAGKATRRAYERLKPGGKIVKTKGSKITKYKKPASKIVRSPGGKVVRSPGGKVVKSPGGKIVRSPGGKLTKRPKVTTQKYKAPKVGKPLRAKTKAGRTVQRTAGKARKTARETAKRVRETKAVSNLNRTKLGKDSLKVRAAKTTKYLRSLRPKTIAKGLKSGAKGLGVGMAVDWAADQAVDRTFRAISGKNKMSLKEFRAERDKKLASFGKKKPKAKGTPLRGGEELSASRRGKQKPNVSTGPYKGGAKVEPVSKKKKKEVSVGNMIGATIKKPKKKVAPKKKLTPRQEWEKKTRNSPARKSGAFTDKQLWEKQKKHREWKKRMGRK